MCQNPIPCYGASPYNRQPYKHEHYTMGHEILDLSNTGLKSTATHPVTGSHSLGGHWSTPTFGNVPSMRVVEDNIDRPLRTLKRLTTYLVDNLPIQRRGMLRFVAWHIS